MRVLRDILFNNPAIDPAKEALICGEERLTYAELQRRVRCIGQALTAAGIRPGDRVALLAENCIEFIELFFGITGIGAVIVPLNYRLSAEEQAAILNDAGPSLLFAAAPYRDNAQHILDHVDGLDRAVAIGDGTPWLTYRDFAADAEPLPLDAPLAPDDVAALLYTSGTTSLPKGVMLMHANYLADYANGEGPLEIRPDIVNLQISPLYHAAAQHTYIQIYGGGTTVLMSKFDPGTVLELIERERVNYFFVVPTMLYNILDHPDFARTDTSRVRMIIYGAAPMTEARRREAVAAFGEVFTHAYGLTECTAMATMLPPAEHAALGGGSIGRGLVGSEVIVADDDGKPVPAGSTGEILVRGRQVMKGYWNRPDATAETLKDGWLHTGDVGSWDADGYVTVIDRKKDLIISGGANIFPKDVEEAVARHPAVAEVAVYGIPHANWGEAVEAAIVLKAGQTLETEELTAFARQHLAGYKVPRSIRVLDALPRNPSGKILKRELRALSGQA